VFDSGSVLVIPGAVVPFYKPTNIFLFRLLCLRKTDSTNCEKEQNERKFEFDNFTKGNIGCTSVSEILPGTREKVGPCACKYLRKILASTPINDKKRLIAQPPFAIQLAPIEDLVGIHLMPACRSGHRCPRHQCLFHDVSTLFKGSAPLLLRRACRSTLTKCVHTSHPL